MELTFVEPLHPETWFASLDRLNNAVEDLDSQHTDALIRQAYYIVRLTPAPLRHLFRTELSESELEGHLKSKAFETVLFKLIGPPLALQISRELDAQEICAVIAVGSSEICGSCSHTEPVKAALSAWTKCLVKLAEVARQEIYASKPA